MTDRYRLGKARRVMKDFELQEISSVDFPAQAGATMAILKRGNPGALDAIAKGFAKYYPMVSAADGTVGAPKARTFADLLQAQLEQRRAMERQQELYPLTDSLFDSLRSIIGDDTMTSEAKQEAIQGSVDDFLAVMRTKWPSVEEAVATALGQAMTEGTAEGDHIEKGGDAEDDIHARFVALKARVAGLNLKASALK